MVGTRQIRRAVLALLLLVAPLANGQGAVQRSSDAAVHTDLVALNSVMTGAGPDTISTLSSGSSSETREGYSLPESELALQSETVTEWQLVAWFLGTLVFSFLFISKQKTRKN